jgi:hypothetical protein
MYKNNVKYSKNRWLDWRTCALSLQGALFKGVCARHKGNKIDMLHLVRKKATWNMKLEVEV